MLALNDADYPWLVLVPRRVGAVEIADLGGPDAARLMEEIRLASRVLKDVTRCDKLNIAAIGNIVPQLHVHIVARRKMLRLSRASSPRSEAALVDGRLGLAAAG